MDTPATSIRKAVAAQAKAKIDAEWGRTFAMIGPRFQRAVMAEAATIIAATQDDEAVSAEVVRRIVTEGWAWIVEEGPA